MEFSPLERKIIKAVTDATKRHWNLPRPQQWTELMKKTLVKVGHERGYRVCASDVRNKLGADDGVEWLYDLAWLDEKPKWQDGRQLALAAEIEWSDNTDHMLHDFQKLTICISDLRLFVTAYRDARTNSIVKLEERVDLCKNACPGSRGFRYLFIALPDKSPDNVKAYAWTS